LILREEFSRIKIDKNQEIAVQPERASSAARKSVQRSKNGRMAALAFKILFRRERVAHSSQSLERFAGRGNCAPTERVLFNCLFYFDQTLIPV